MINRYSLLKNSRWLLTSILGIFLCFQTFPGIASANGTDYTNFTSTISDCTPDPLPGHTFLGLFENHLYFISNAGTNPSNAHLIADGLGGYLVSITSEAENNWVSSLVPGYVTIGANDVATEGSFVWASGEPFVYSSWWPGEPNNVGNEDYVVTNFGAIGSWNDVPDWVQPLYVIEFDLNDLPEYWTCGKNDNKVLMCHVPPDNPDNFHTICVGKGAVADHLSHGDYIGSCCEEEEPSSLQENPINIKHSAKETSLEIYPNPAQDQIQINLHSAPGNSVTLQVTDLLGNKLIDQRHDLSGDLNMSVDLSSLVPGTYNISVKTDEGFQSIERISKMR